MTNISSPNLTPLNPSQSPKESKPQATNIVITTDVAHKTLKPRSTTNSKDSMKIEFLKTTNDIQAQILNELADGQWHPLYKITQKIERGSNKAKLFKQKLTDELDLLVAEDVLMSGNNESYRFNSKILADWRRISSSPKLMDKQYQPRYFGGILEDDGWLLSELKEYDLIHFHASSTLSQADIHAHIGGKLARIQIEDGLYRVFSNDGIATFAKMQGLKEARPDFEIRGMRLEKDLRRRELDDLPRPFVNDLARYYGNFAKVLLRPYMSSVTKHINDVDDIQQQIYLWVLDAIQRYDATTSIPFAAYLSSSLAKWVFNLNRKAYGRAVADTELKHARAIADFKARNGRDPKPEELAELLQENLSDIKKDSAIISTVFNLRNIGTINSDEEHELQLPSDFRVEENIDRLSNNSILSAAITTAAKQDNSRGKGIIGLVGIYYETWGIEHKTKRIKVWSRTQPTQAAITRVQNKAREILQKDSFNG